MNKKNWILIIIAALVVFIGVYFKNTPQAPDWKVFDKSGYGLTFKYPSNTLLVDDYGYALDDGAVREGTLDKVSASLKTGFEFTYPGVQFQQKEIETPIGPAKILIPTSYIESKYPGSAYNQILYGGAVIEVKSKPSNKDGQSNIFSFSLVMEIKNGEIIPYSNELPSKWEDILKSFTLTTSSNN